MNSDAALCFGAYTFLQHLHVLRQERSKSSAFLRYFQGSLMRRLQLHLLDSVWLNKLIHRFAKAVSVDS